MDEIQNLKGKICHKKWRALVKKFKRKQKRQLIAKQHEDEHQDEEVSESSDEEIKLAEERRRRQEHDLWLERERIAQAEWRNKQEWQAKETRRREEEKRIREEWEEQQRKEREEKERGEKEAEEKKKKQDELLREATKNQRSQGDSDWHNPIAPVLLPGIERDPCPFFLRVGACRFGDRCSRAHVGVESSCTLLFPGMYSHFELDQGLRDDMNADLGLEFEEGETYSAFRDFYEDVFPEMRRFGRIVQFKVCCNYEPHLRGNVYVQYKREEDALAAFARFNGRWYGGRQISCQFSHITDWKKAICGLFFRNRCPKGKNCNFMHVFRNPNNEFWHFDTTEVERYSERRSERHLERRRSRSRNRSVRSERYRRSRSRSPRSPKRSPTSRRRRTHWSVRAQRSESHRSVSRSPERQKKKKRKKRSSSRSSRKRSTRSRSPASPHRKLSRSDSKQRQSRSLKREENTVTKCGENDVNNSFALSLGNDDKEQNIPEEKCPKLHVKYISEESSDSFSENGPRQSPPASKSNLDINKELLDKDSVKEYVQHVMPQEEPSHLILDNTEKTLHTNILNLDSPIEKSHLSEAFDMCNPAMCLENPSHLQQTKVCRLSSAITEDTDKKVHKSLCPQAKVAEACLSTTCSGGSLAGPLSDHMTGQVTKEITVHVTKRETDHVTKGITHHMTKGITDCVAERETSRDLPESIADCESDHVTHGSQSRERKIRRDRDCASSGESIRRDRDCASSGESIRRDRDCASSGESIRRDRDCASSGESIRRDRDCASSWESIRRDRDCASSGESSSEDERSRHRAKKKSKSLRDKSHKDKKKHKKSKKSKHKTYSPDLTDRKNPSVISCGRALGEGHMEDTHTDVKAAERILFVNNPTKFANEQNQTVNSASKQDDDCIFKDTCLHEGTTNVPATVMDKRSGCATALDINREQTDFLGVSSSKKDESVRENDQKHLNEALSIVDEYCKETINKSV